MDKEMKIASAPDPMDERNTALENLADSYFGKPLKDLTPKANRIFRRSS
jgi:hypothetical protein